MSWQTTATVVKEFSLDELLKKESNWESGYNEPDRWKKDMADCYYALYGEYEVEEGLVLYRFELDEAYRKHLAHGAPHYHNVLIRIAPKRG